MARHFTDDRLILASHNEGKVREISDLVAPFGVTAISAASAGLPEPEETGLTFIANAKLKALAAAEASGLVALADDSGLVVPALGGDPGIYSARWAGPDKNFAKAMSKVEDGLNPPGGAAKPRDAWFACALALCWPDGHCECFEGRVDGMLIWPPRGTLGFGYDPMFIPAGEIRTFGEIPPDEKHEMSHRADAFRKLIAACFAGQAA